jgi:brefeldin A-resistance guanine nucleotide exchange factor 1
MFQTLFLHSLLPTPMLQMEDFLAGTTTIAMKPAVPAQSDARRAESGLLSTLSSYLLSPYGAGAEGVVTDATDEDVENTLTAVDCISSCRLEELYAEILYVAAVIITTDNRNLEVEALLPALRAIKTLAEARTVGRLRRTSLDSRADGPTSPTIASAVVRDGQLPYDPACVFHLEMMISLATHSKPHIAETW